MRRRPLPATGGSHFLVAQWTETSRAAVRAARQHGPAGTVATQGHVLAPGDFVHTLAVEGVVHHLDLTLKVPSPGLSDAAYELVVEVLTGLLGAELRDVVDGGGRSSRAPAVSHSATSDRESLGSGCRALSPLRLTEYRREMATVRAAAVQAAYVLMDQQATLDKAIGYRGGGGAGCPDRRVPEVFIPGTPIWIDSRPIWDGDEQWYAMLVDQAVVVPGPVTDALGAAARAAGTYVVMASRSGSRTGRRSTTRPCTSDRTGRCWQAPQADADGLRADGVGDGRRLDAAGGRHAVRPAQWADLLGELHAAGPVLPLLAGRRHLGRADPGSRGRLGRDYAAHRPRGPVLRHRRQPVPPPRPDPGRLPRREASGPSSPTTTVGRARQHRSSSPERGDPRRTGAARGDDPHADLDLDAVRAARRLFDPVGHYNRPDVFHLAADLRARPAVMVTATSDPADAERD